MWSADGNELFFRLSRVPGSDLPIQLMGIEVTTAEGFTFRNAQTLPLGSVLQFQNYRDYDIAPDGQQFVVITPAEGTGNPVAVQPAALKVNIVLNWFEELKARVPVP